jgi:hypothetical protein
MPRARLGETGHDATKKTSCLSSAPPLRSVNNGADDGHDRDRVLMRESVDCPFEGIVPDPSKTDMDANGYRGDKCGCLHQCCHAGDANLLGSPRKQ